MEGERVRFIQCIYHHTVNESGNFCCKNIFIVDGGYKNLILQKLARTINANVVRGRSYEFFYTIQKFLHMKISRSTVLSLPLPLPLLSLLPSIPSPSETHR